MFTTYVKSLNDMVFSTSESPEEQPSTGVLGRIGSWFSPWRGRSPKSPTENADDQVDKAEGVEDGKESVKPQAEQEDKDQSSNPNPLPLTRDIFPSEQEDATQSAHRDVNSTEPGEGGPKEEESGEHRKERTGQGKEREENGNGTLLSGNPTPDKNASHLTHRSSSAKQEVPCGSDQARTQPQAQTSKTLHVYLEETSVIHSNQNTCAGQEVICTKVKTSYQVLPKSPTSPSYESSKRSSSAEFKRINDRTAAGEKSYYSVLVGVPLKPGKDSQVESERNKGQSEVDDMGRKNTARRKNRKNSQGDGGNSSQENSPSTAHPAQQGFPTSDKSVTSPQGKRPESPVNSSSKHNPTSEASPEGGEAKPLATFQDSNSVASATPARVVDVSANMEDDDSFYKVERKTETPESKRRSMKVSQSEVKFFPKNVPLKAEQSPAGVKKENKPVSKNTKDEANDKSKTKIEPRLQDLKKTDEENKSPAGRIADKITLFEGQRSVGAKPSIQFPRSADVSPVRKRTDRLKAESALTEQRSRSAERYGTSRSSSSSPGRDKFMSVKERAKNFAEACITEDRGKVSQKSVMTRMSHKPASAVTDPASKSQQDGQGKLHGKEQTHTTTMPEITFKSEGADTTAEGSNNDILTERQTDSTVTKKEVLKTANRNTKPNAVESVVPNKGQDGSAEATTNISPQSKGPNRTGSRSKRRKSKEPTSPISPSSENKAETSTDKKSLEEQVNKSEDTASAAKPLLEEVFLPSDKDQKNIAEKQTLTDVKLAIEKELNVSDKKTEEANFSLKKNSNKQDSRQEGLPKLPVSKDEPDTAAYCSGTKAPIDKDVVSAKKEEKADEHSLVLTQQMETASKDGKSSVSAAPSPVVEQLNEKTPSVEREPPVEHPKIEKDPSVTSETKVDALVHEEDAGQKSQHQNKNTDLIKQAGEQEKTESEQLNQTESKDKDKAKLLSSGEKSTDDRLAEDLTKPQVSKPESAPQSSVNTSGSSDLPAQTQHVGHSATTHPENNVVCVDTRANEAVCGTSSDKELSKGDMATNVPGFQTETKKNPGTEKEPAVTVTEPQPKSVSVEKTENSADDSHAHGPNDGESSSSKLITNKTTVEKEVSVKATNNTPVLITAKSDNMAKKEPSVTASSPISVIVPVSGNTEKQDDGNKSLSVKLAAPEVKISGDLIKASPSHSQCEQSNTTAGTGDNTTVKGTEKITPSPSDSATPNSKVNLMGKTAGKTLDLPVNELVANGDISLHPQPDAVKKKVSNKPSQTLKAPSFPEANKLIPDSHSSAMKRLNLPRRLSKDDSTARQDAPSSWLDVDFPKQKPRFSETKLTSSGSESNLLDTSGELDDEDFVEKIKKLCAPFSLPPRKHTHHRPPQPPFAMPAIKESTFDPEEFTFGLRKKIHFSLDSSPLAGLQSKESKPAPKPARASFADRSMLLSGLDTHSRLREKTPVEEEDAKEEKDDQIKVKSRLEGSCVLSSLTTSSFTRGKRNGGQAQAENTNSGNVSPSETPQPSPPPLSQSPLQSPTAPGPLKHPLTKQSIAPNNREEAPAAEVVVSDSGPPLPSFNDIKLPDYLEKYLPREVGKPAQNVQGQERINTEVGGKMATSNPGSETVSSVKPEPVLPDALSSRCPGISPNTLKPTVPELKQQQKTPSNNIRVAKGFHKRPGKMVLFEKAPFSGQVYEIYKDVEDASSLQLSPLVSVKVVRGCWVLYEKPGFQGRNIALEEGAIELTNVWADSGPQTEPQSDSPMLIGSIRLAVWDYSLPHIDLFTEPEGRGRVTPYHDDTVETGSFGIPLSTASIQVHSGVWLVFSDPGFQGMLGVLETGVYPFPETWGFPSPFVGSLRPLKMGGFKVENSCEVKAVVYERPGFEGSSLEVDSDIFSFCESDGDSAPELESTKLTSARSLKINGGLWVGYSQPGFEGQQYILEEGEYLDCSDWGGLEIHSLRPVLSDFMSPHLKMFSDRDFGKLGVNIDLTVPVINMDDTGYGMKTQSIDVIGGVWVVFEEPGFCGECYILEKGLYGSPEDWGALVPRIASAMPVVQDDFENAAKFKVQLFTDPGFQGSVLTLEDSEASLQQGFSVASCKVLAGSWMAFEGQDFTDKMYILEEGSYPDLRAMGCVHANASILSLQTVGFEFSLPSIILFERCGLKGKRVVLTDGSVNLQLAGGCGRVQSVVVEGGMWVLYEEINYRGAQMLLKPGEVPDWRSICSWKKIGSLRPLIQRQMHFHLRNQQTGLLMSASGDLDEIKLMRVQEMEETNGFEQIWSYQNGHLHCKLLEECCLGPSGSMTMAGSRVGFTPALEDQIHLWSITPEGFICHTPSNLVLDVKGGHHYDKNQVILNTLDPNKQHQRWSVEIL
ncbi:uncharacterized protein LOC115415031 [Sphaeramia orbicularis]|uniref:uncharacterized protein LOC115415031 n=1 Tax=Sphaeramia orbicularis TaxID=375764 RepID=UPI0011808D1C|nr:uncharacterized protein LOC115415031 [Sphaeramia orbicularis]